MHDSPDYAEIVVMTAQHVEISLAIVVWVCLMMRLGKHIIETEQTVRRVLVLYHLAKRLAFVTAGLLLASHLAPALVFGYAEQSRLFFLPYIGITSLLAGLATFYYYRNAGLLWFVTTTGSITHRSDVAVEHILSVKRILMSSTFWVIGFSFIGFILAADRIESVFIGRTDVFGVLWFLGGISIMSISTFSLVMLRMQDEHDLLRHYRIDEYEALSIADSEGDKTITCDCSTRLRVPPKFKESEITCPHCGRIHPI